MAVTRKRPRTKQRILDARPDTADFRDRMFEPTLVDVPESAPLSRYTKVGVPVLDQGDDGACTAFGLATVAHYLLRTRGAASARGRKEEIVSTRMLYDMARRYDEWRGEGYSGSSCRGAMKGWHHHGVCSETVWPYTPGTQAETYTEARARDAMRRPLGAYYRVNHKDLVSMHAAFAEVGILYASCAVHDDWLDVPESGVIQWKEQDDSGYHAFAIVGFDGDGFWIQNSWGNRWGKRGFGHVSYDEWLQRGTDVWVARLAVPVQLRQPESAALNNSSLARQSTGYSQADLRPHVISLGNDGQLRASGRFGTTVDDVRNLIRNDLSRITKGWKKKRVLLYAHGGLVPEDTAIQRIADYREAMLAKDIYPLCFVWKSDLWTTLGNILRDVARPRSEGILDRTKSLMLDRLDDTLEPLARVFGGKTLWDEMKENAIRATTAVARRSDGVIQESGGAALTARLLAEWMGNDADVELHLAGHSGGAVLLAPLVQLLTTSGRVASGPAMHMEGLGKKIASVNLWAPAATVDLFLQTYGTALHSRAIDRAAVFTLTDKAENDDHCAGVYHKSLLYLIAHALETQPRNWIDSRHRHGTPLVGMARFIEASSKLSALLASGHLDWIQSPAAGKPEGSPDAANATTHGAFDDDRAILQATVARILGQRSGQVRFDINRTEAGLDDRRNRLHRAICNET